LEALKRKTPQQILQAHLDQNSEQKKPRKTGALVGRDVRGRCPAKMIGGGASETKIGQVAIADGDASAGHQQTIDNRHQAAE
jgi:hypothetical protein